MAGRIVASLGMAAGLLVGLDASPARAATTWVVDQEADEAPDPGNQCTAAPDDCSLRQAVDAAADGDTISIAPGVDPQLTLGHIVVTEDLTIVGEGGQADTEPLVAFPGTRLDAAHTSRILDIAAGADVVLTDLLLQRGQAPADEDGGAVRNAGTLRLERVTVTNNRTTGAGDGGGLFSSGSLTVIDVAFSGVIALANTAPNEAGGDGAAIATTGALHVERANFSQNVAAGIRGGGAISVHGGTADIVNATFYRNVTSGVGGAIYADAGATMSLVSASVARNEAAWGGGGVGTDGGAQLAVVATWFQDNLPDTCAGAITAGADSLVWPADPNCPATMTATATWPSTVPAPGVSFGFTAVLRLLESSPAIDAIPAPGGVCSLGAQVDQRGIARPAVAGCDIGAFEAKENLFIGFDPNRTAMTLTFPDGVERDVPLYAGNGGAGADRTATGVQVQLTFPSGVTVHSVTPPAGTTYDAGTGIWTVGDIAPVTQTDPLIVRLSRNAPGDHVVTAEISSDEPGTAETATLTVHEPADRYAVVGGPASGDCLTLATGCAIEYAVEVAAQETETIFVAPGEHVTTSSLGVTNKSIVALDPTDRPTIRADLSGGMLTTAGTVRFADVDFVSTDAGLSTSGAANATLERITVRAARRALFTGNGSLTFRDSVLEAVGGSPSGQPFHHALVLAAPATIENVTVIGRGTGAILARTSGQTHSLANVIARDLDGGIDVAAETGVTVDLTSSSYGTTGGTGTVTPAGTAGNQSLAPVFVDAAGHDFRQATGSPTIDAGTGTPDAERRDFEGGPRVFGTSVDIGGDEYGPIAGISPTSHDFGSVGFHNVVFKVFTITNRGSAALTVGAPTFSGADSHQYGVLGPCTPVGPVAPGASCALPVVFSPNVAGPRPVLMTVPTNAGPVEASLTGTGVDTSPPMVSPVVGPSTPSSGWHTTDVLVTWAVFDFDGPILHSTGCGPSTILFDGTTTLTCTATSAGGTSSNTVTIKRDGTKPTIAVTRTPASPDGANGWYVTAPTISFECDDDTSGVATCPGPVTLGSSASGQTVTGVALDVAGNQRTVTSPSMKVDLVDPTVTCAATLPTFAVGANGSVSATVTDAHSGPVAGTVSSPAVTTVAGSFTVAVTGADVAGRTTTIPCPYLVQRVATTLVADPIVTRGLAGLITRVQPSAVLTRTDTGAPIAGQPVTITLTRGPQCTAVTDANGRATCGNVIVILNVLGGGTYKATYAGNATYQPSAGTGTIP
jgi:hypothetical protein